jgi:methyl-accepting chemotaxis protein
MALFSRLNRLSIKLPLFVIGCVALSSLAVGAAAYVVARKAALSDQGHHLEALVRNQADSLVTLLHQLESDMHDLGTNPTVSQALSGLTSAWSVLESDQSDKLRATYVTGNPLPAGERYKFDGATDTTMYGIYHAKVHDYFLKVRAAKALPDLYLISEEGDVVFSNEKRDDFATNLLTDPFKDSGLAKAFRAALEGAESDLVAFSDVSDYPPARGGAAFLARAVKDRSGNLYGIIAVQVPMQRVDAVFAEPFGESGRMYVVGADDRVRSRLPGEKAVRNQSYPDEPGGASGTAGQRPGLDGVLSASVSMPVDAYGQLWRVVGEQPVSEIEAPLRTMLLTMSAIGAAIFLALGVVGTLGARSLYRPIVRMRDAVAALVRGEEVAIEAASRGD